MNIKQIKQALVELRDMCRCTMCSKCEIAKADEAGVPYCPLEEYADGTEIRMPDEWDVDEWRAEE